MADIFLSYARDDREKAQELAEALGGTGWSVFWDRTIPPGLTWRSYIGKALEEARCIVVAWSESSVESEWVLDEADLAKRKGILIPVLFEAVEPPLGFGAFQALDLSGWDKKPDASEVQDLVAGMERLLGPPPSREEEARREEAERARRTVEAEREAEAETQREAEEEEKRRRVRRVDSDLIFAGPQEARKAKAAALVRWLRSGPGLAVGGVLVVAISLLLWYRPWEGKSNRLVLIEGGDFRMGSPEGVGYDDEHPQHRVLLSPFCIQEHEVTNEEYRRFKPEHEFPQREEKHPVVNVSWEDANAYAKWLGGSLPTEAQWEFAARSRGLNQTYPWGDEPADCSRAIIENENGDGCGRGGSWPVCSKPEGNTAQGLCDMAGNVWEWVADWYDGKEYSRRAQGLGPGEAVENPLGPPPSGRRVDRGGSFNFPAGDARSALRSRDEPGDRFSSLGFRVVLPAPC